MTARPLAMLRCLARDRRGNVIIELAVLLPILILLAFGFFEVYAYVRATAVIERTTASLANLMARQLAPLIDCDTANDALNLGTYIALAERSIRPLDLPQNGTIILSGVTNPGQPTVSWQRRSPYTVGGGSVLGRQGALANLPTGLAPPIGGSTVLVAEVFYRYRPFAITGNWLGAPGTVTIRRANYFMARTFNQGALGRTQNCTGLPVP